MRTAFAEDNDMHIRTICITCLCAALLSGCSAHQPEAPAAEPSATPTATPAETSVPENTSLPSVLGDWDPTDPLYGSDPSADGTALGCVGSDAVVNVIVYMNQGVTAVYDQDGTLIRALLCSPGKDRSCYGSWSGYSDKKTVTLGTERGAGWHSLYGGVYTPAYITIYDAILFHCVPYYSMSRDTLEIEEYKKLGTPASLGCIRLALGDLVWLYNHVGPGSTVTLSYSQTYEGEIPEAAELPES